MIKVSASYVYCNPNFVIQNLDEPENWAHPIFAVLKNILMRGCPTIPSLFLREKFGNIEHEKEFKYNLDFNGLDWNGVIKGGATSNPAFDFYYNILTKYIPFGGSFIPECPVSSILPGLELGEVIKNSQVDFYSPYYNVIIEIDGIQHNNGEQQAKDLLRDKLFQRYGVKTIRLSTQQVQRGGFIKKYFINGAWIDRGGEVKPNYNLAEREILYATSIRLQTLLLYLYGTGRLSLEQETLDLSLGVDFHIEDSDVKIMLDDFYCWLDNLAALQNIPFKKPSIHLYLHNAKDIHIFREGIAVDISLTKVYCIPKEENIFYIRNDYFKYGVSPYKRVLRGEIVTQDRDYYKVACSPIQYNLNKELHAEYLIYILRNVSVREYSDFRENQLEIILEALNSRAVIGILPTGAGKSLCYQIAALLIPSMTLVVSPLKILMVDQYEHLCENLGLNHSTFINSSHTGHLEFFRTNKSLITLIAPERFFSEKFSEIFIDAKLKAKVGFVVIDEAHCLSEWGHDFRTSYLCLSHNLERLLPADTFLMALTGTASYAVFKDIESEFYYFKKKKCNALFASNMKRTNLEVCVKAFSDEEGDADIYQALSDNISPTVMGNDKTKTLVFTKTKKSYKGDRNESACIPLADHFKIKASTENKSGDTVAYYASDEDLSETEKEKILSNFKYDTELKVLFATKAFGMGVDIKDIRKTIHFGLPSSIEGLYQQIGRAGRDQKESKCYIYFQKEKRENYDFYFKYFTDIERKEETGEDNRETASSSIKIRVKEIKERMGSLKELGTNFYFLQNSNLDIEEEKVAVLAILREIKKQNKKGVQEIDLTTLCNILKSSSVEINGKLDKNNKQIIVERALYRLFLLGEIDMWNLVYGAEMSNPMFINLHVTGYKESEKHTRVVQHIKRYDNRESVVNIGETLDARLGRLLQWSYDNFFMERIKSMKTLYDWCVNFKDSNKFMESIAKYFSNDPEYVILVDDQMTLQDWIRAVQFNPFETKLRIARLLESYENITALNYVSGITRLRLFEFSDFDGERRLNKSFEGVRLLLEDNRKKLFMGTYEILENEGMRNTFVGKWIEYIPQDVYWIYDGTKNEQAERYLLADFADKFLKIKEKIDAKLQ